MQKKYRINEIFYSIQGEGFYTGMPAVFIRFSGCNLKCEFCDTRHEKYKELTIIKIIKQIRKYPTKFIVLTGGEPLLQVDKDAMDCLKKNNYYVCVETNGTVGENIQADWITCSPKRDSAWRIKIVPNEIKIVWDKNLTQKEIKQFHKLFNVKKYIQPEGNKKENIEKAISFIKKYPQEWRLSLQCQKIINIQ